MRLKAILCTLVLGALGVVFFQASAKDNVGEQNEARVILKVCTEYAQKATQAFSGPQECRDSALAAQDGSDFSKVAKSVLKKIKNKELNEDQESYAKDQEEKATDALEKAQDLKKICLEKGGTVPKTTFRDEVESCIKDRKSLARGQKSCELAKQYKELVLQEQRNEKDLKRALEVEKRKKQAKDLVTGKTNVESLQATILESSERAVKAKDQYLQYFGECDRKMKKAPASVAPAPKHP